MSNLFAFDPVGFGNDTILGFDPTRDAIEVATSQFGDFNALQGRLTSAAGGTLITLNGSQSILVGSVAPSSLTAANVLRELERAGA